MNNTFITIIGLLAGAITTFAQLPQLVKIIKTKSVDDVSKGMYFMLITGVSLWVGYGILITSIPVVVANVVALALVSIILFLDLRYQRSAN